MNAIQTVVFYRLQIVSCAMSDATTYRTHAEIENSPAYLIQCGYLIGDCVTLEL